MKSWEEFAQEVQPERQPGAPDGDNSANEDFSRPEAVELKKEKLTRNLRNKLMAMAMAGFVTLGGAWQKSYADQLKIAKHEGGKPEFLLEVGITDEKLASFRERVEKEEPEFKKWIDKCEAEIKKEIDRFTEDILSFQINGKTDLHLEAEIRLFSASYPDDFDLDAESVIIKDHQFIQYFQEHPQVLENLQQFIKLNMSKIIWSIVLLDDSRASRDQLVANVLPPKINFMVHDNEELSHLHAVVNPVPVEQSWQTQVSIFPLAFLNSESGDISRELYLNVLTHEIVHAFHCGGQKASAESGSNLRKNLREGITQNIAFEIIQYLGSKREWIRPAISYINYDDRLISSAILDAILRTGREPDVLAKWHIGVLGDKELVQGLTDALSRLGLDTGIAQDIEDFIGVRTEQYSASYQMLIDLLARLEISGIKLSPSFIRNIVASNRLMDDWQSEKLDTLLRLGSLAEIIRDNKARIEAMKQQLNQTKIKKQ